MEAQIGAIAPYQEFHTMMRQVAGQLGISVETAVASDAEAGASIRRWESEGHVRLVLVHELTAVRFDSQSLMPLQTLRITSMDVLNALKAARTLGGSVALIHETTPQTYDPVALGAILGVKVYPLVHDTELDRSNCLKQAQSLGAAVIVSSNPAMVALARARNMQAVLITLGTETLQASLEQAVERVRSLRWERGREHLGQVLFEMTGQGMVVANGRDIITVVNNRAEKLLDISAGQLIGHSVQEALRFPRFADVYQEGSELTGQLRKVGGTPMVVDRRFVTVDGQRRGLAVAFQPISQVQMLEGKIRKQLYTQGLVAWYSFSDIIGTSSVLKQAVGRARRFAPSDLSVLIMGESGTGKELFAQSIHREGPRRDGPFVAVNCAALPENLLESELFGYEEGAFTGARKGGKPGLFELAHGGTIFLDEVGELGIHLQARLLRVLEQRQVMRLGGDRIIPVDVRVVAATNRDLGRAVEEGHFRSDLYYRLNVLPLRLPPLRSRREDIGLLVQTLLHQEAARQNVRPIQLTAEMVDTLQSHHWPGNVRELANVIRSMLLLAADSENPAAVLREILAELSPPHPESTGVPPTDTEHIQIRIGPLDDMVTEIISRLRSARGWDHKELAQRLGVSRTTVWKRLRTNSG